MLNKKSVWMGRVEGRGCKNEQAIEAVSKDSRKETVVCFGGVWFEDNRSRCGEGWTFVDLFAEFYRGPPFSYPTITPLTPFLDFIN